MRRAQNGNAVVFILIAIALFGALSYTFMRGAQTGQGNLTAGQTKLAAQELVNYSQLVERTVNKLRQKGCSETEITFEGAYLPSGSPHSFLNPNAPSDKHCHIFDPAGGGMTDKQFNSLMTPPADGYNIYIHQNALQDAATTAPELIMLVPNLTLAACNAINNILGVTGDMTTDNVHVTSFIGSYGPLAGTIGDSDATNPDTIKGHTSFCMQHSYPFYIYVKVLLER